MTTSSPEDGLRIVDEDTAWDVEDACEVGSIDTGLGTLRDAFVDGFNSHDLDAVAALVHAEVECPDLAGEGFAVLAEELEAIWERSPGAILTGGYLDETPVAVGWLPDEDGCWSRAALVCFDTDGEVLTLVTLPDDADALDRAEADDPTGDELDECCDWNGWERGEETLPHNRP